MTVARLELQLEVNYYELTRRAYETYALREVLFDCLKDYGIDEPNESLIKQFEY